MSKSSSPTQPLRVLQVGWGYPPRQKGGAIFYTKALCSALAKRGHEVTYFYTGSQDLLPFAYLRSSQDGPIRLIELVNSPNFYHAEFNSAESELTNSTLERKFRQVLARVKPDVVHFQNLAGISGSLMILAKDYGAAVIYSLHNYMPICPTGELFDHRRNQICDLRDGRGCFEPRRPSGRYWRKVYVFVAGLLPAKLKEYLGRFLSPTVSTDTADSEDRTGYLEEEKERLNYFHQAFEKIDLGLAVSTKVKELYDQALQLSPDKIKVSHVGNEEAETMVVTRPKRTDQKIRFIFLGSLAPYKGFPVLLEAFKTLDQSRSELLVYAPIDKSFAAQQLELEKSYSIHFKGGYSPKDLGQILSSADVGIVPPIWHDNAPRVVFEFFGAKLPIIASSVGGMSDFVFDGKNGFIYPYNQPAELAKRLQRFIDQPELIEKFRSQIQPMKSVAEHMEEVEGLYYQLLDHTR